MVNSRAKGTGNSSGVRVLLRISSGFLQIVLNLALYALVIWFIYKGATYVYDFAYDVMSNKSAEEEPGREVTVQILIGESSMNVANKLETLKVIPEGSHNAFYLRSKINAFGAKEDKGDIKPGTYKLDTSMTYKEILNIITDASNSIEKEETVEDVESAP